MRAVLTDVVSILCAICGIIGLVWALVSTPDWAYLLIIVGMAGGALYCYERVD